MPRASRLRHATLLAAIVAVACGTDTIELLPLGTGGSAAGAAGSVSAAGLGGGGTSLGGASAGLGGSSGGSSGAGGSFATGGGGCSGLGCGGFGSENGFGGFGGDGGDCDDNHFLCPCGPQGRCAFGTKCNPRLDVCLAKCENALECREGFLCEDRTCTQCSLDEQCQQFGTFERNVCVEGRCEECRGPSDCPDDRPMCVYRRCVQCDSDDDCPESAVCDEARGRCEK